MWVLFMNAMDLLPLDLVGFGVHHLAGAEAAHHTYWRIVPTADLNTTLAMSTVVFLLTIFYSIKRSEEHTSELQSLMRISYAVFCLKKKTKTITSNLKMKSIH